MPSAISLQIPDDVNAYLQKLAFDLKQRTGDYRWGVSTVIVLLALHAKARKWEIDDDAIALLNKTRIVGKEK